MKTVDVTIFVEASQIFDLIEDRPDNDQIEKDFSLIECILDPAPPCAWKVTDLKVDHVKIDGDQLRRQYSCTITISAGEDEIENLKTFMDEEGYYDADEEEFDWHQGINFCIAETTCCNEDYATWNSDNVSLDVMEIGNQCDDDDNAL